MPKGSDVLSHCTRPAARQPATVNSVWRASIAPTERGASGSGWALRYQNQMTATAAAGQT